MLIYAIRHAADAADAFIADAACRHIDAAFDY